jgi:hypothetical protein
LRHEKISGLCLQNHISAEQKVPMPSLCQSQFVAADFIVFTLQKMDGIFLFIIERWRSMSVVSGPLSVVNIRH